MEASILHDFLRCNLITGNQNLEQLAKIAAVLEIRLQKRKEKIITYTLVAFDRDIPPDEPILREVLELFTREGIPLPGDSNDIPRTIIRAVILETLYSLVKKNDPGVGIIWFTANNIINCYNLGREEKILVNILRRARDQVEYKARETWDLENKLPEQFKLAPFQINRSWEDNYPKNGVDTGSDLDKRLKNFAMHINKELNKHIKDQIDVFLPKFADSFFRIAESIERRNRLIWWKESLYSRELKKSYRDMHKFWAPVTMAYDLSGFVDCLYPASVDYLLKEGILKVLNGKDKKIKFSKLMEFYEGEAETDIGTAIYGKKIYGEKVFEKKSIAKEIVAGGRMTLLSFIKALHGKLLSPRDFKDKLGIEPDNTIKSADFGLWIFHDLEALKISDKK